VPIPRFPAVERDFSLVLSDGVAFAQVADTIRALAIPQLRSVEPADLFRGGKMPAGKFSLMVRVTFQSGETTFTDAQINDFSARIVSALETKLGATLRAS
jgi:phenylalanyl-tRNA synthetase beta chain